MKRMLFSLFLACLPAGLAAQGTDAVARDFAAAFARYFPTGEADLMQTLTDGLMLVPALQGDWVPAHVLFPDGRFDADRFATACDRMGVLRIAPTGAFGFTMTRMRGDEPTGRVTTYSFVAGNTFTRSTNIDGLIADLFPNRQDGDALPPAAISSVTNPMNHGYAIVRMESPNIAVIESVGGTPFLLARCS